MTTKNHAALRRVSTYLRSNMTMGGDGHCFGPFAALIDPAGPELFRNYAIPQDGVEPSNEDVLALIAGFEMHGRTPRLEYIPDLCPAVLPALEQHGFQIEQYMPLMICTSVTLAPVPEIQDVEWRIVGSMDDLEIAANVQNRALGAPEATQADVDRLHLLIQSRGAVALAQSLSTGIALGSGIYSRPIDKVAEIAAIGVAEHARGRGIGSGLTALLARHAMEHGVELPFLMAAEENADRVYTKAGFERFGTMLHTSRN